MKYNRTKMSVTLIVLVVLYMVIRHYLLTGLLHLSGVPLMVINVLFIIAALYVAQAVSKEGPKEEDGEDSHDA